MASKKEVFGVDVNGDISGLKKAMNDAVRVFNSTERSLKNVNKALQLDPTDEKLLEKQRDLYKQAIKENENALKSLKKVRNEIVNDPNFKKGVTEMKEKFTSVDLEIKKVTEEGKKLKKELKNLPSEDVAKIKDKFTKLEESVKKSKDAIEKIHRALENVNKQIELNPRNLDLYTQKTELLNEELRVTEFAIRNIKERLKSIESSDGWINGLGEYKQQWTEYHKQLEEYEKKAKDLRKEIKNELSPSMQAFVNVMGKVGKKFGEIGEKTKQLSRYFQLLSIASLKASMDYESNIANIRRVVSDLSDDTIKNLKNIAVETGSAFKDISDYATIGGALGLAEQDLSKFTKTMIDLNTATGGVFSGEEGAKGIAVFLKQLNLGIDQAENFGSAIAVIGDKYADIGDETVNVATRLTGLNSIINTNQYELIGLAGVMADLGLATDSNANGINRAFIQLDKTISGGVKNASEKLNTIARTSGMTAEEFKKAWGENAMDAFLKFTDGLKSSVFNEINEAIETSNDEITKFADILGVSAEQFKNMWSKDSKKVFDMYVEALGEMGEEGTVASKVLSDLGISSVNTAQTLLRLAGSGNEVRSAIKLTEQAWRDNTALAEKSGIIYNTTAYKLKGLWEALKQLGATLGDIVLPHIKNFAENLTSMIQGFQDLSPVAKTLITTFVGFGASISPISRGVEGLIKTLPRIIGFLTGPGGIIMAIGSLVFALSDLKSKADMNEYAMSMKSIQDEARSLDEQLQKNVETADRLYQAQYRQIQDANLYALEVDKLVDILKEQNLTEEQSAEIKDKIRGYVEKLNEVLGTEAFVFDEATGKIISQGEEVDKVKSKFDELAESIKKEAWLNAHKEVLEQAYSDLDTSTAKMDTATKNFLKEAESIPADVRELLKDFNGSLQEFQNMLDVNMIDYNEELAQKWYGVWEQYDSTVKETQALVEHANDVVDGYIAVADAEAGTLDQAIWDATQYISTWQTGVDTAQVSLAELIEMRETYASHLSEEEKQNDRYLQQLDEQIAKHQEQNDLMDIKHEKDLEANENAEKLFDFQSKSLETLKKQKDKNDELLEQNWKMIDPLKKELSYQQSRYDYAQKTKSTTQETINMINSYTPPTKTMTIVARYVGFSGGSPGGNATHLINSDGFGISTRYGDLFKTAIDSVNRTLGNYNSGGYSSGGITVNANFNVNSNNIGRNDVRNWSSWIIDDINEALGKAM